MSLTKQLDIATKQNVSYCIPLSLRDEQIKINLVKVPGRVVPEPELRNDEIAIVCYAPSLKDTWQQLKNFKYIMTCSGAHKFLLERGIVPSYHVDLDPREHKLKLLGTPDHNVQYLIASTIHPKYLDVLQGHDVKLWHIFANEEDGARVLPRGEWSITGGSSVGLRCLTLARFLGFANMHVFGMDGSFTKEGTHTSEHPNSPKENYETQYNGRKFLTTPSMLHVAQETFHELDQMPDCKFTFYGDGLVQAMSKDYKPAPRHKTMIGVNKPELISKEYISLNRKLHQDVPTFGMGGAKHTEAIINLSKELKTTSILDYGCGKGMLARELPFPIWEYDPAVPEKSAPPKPADIVVCTDVLEHIEPDKLKFVLDDIRFCMKKVGYFVISTRKALKTYANGQNTHLLVKDKAWWEKQLSKFFQIGTVIHKERESELHIVVGPKPVITPDMLTIEKDGVVVKFLTPNETTKWRANTLFTKEPSTVEWIKSMQPGEVLFDIGANVGSYSVLAGVRGIKVFSFEPEAENYALLVKNLTLNEIEPNAYCLAASDEEKAGTLYAGQQGVGGACHSFNEAVGHNLLKRKSEFTQGCFGIPLDTMVERGLPTPHHLKIDVDGLEHKVVKGAAHIIGNGLKSLLVEVNPLLPEHTKMVETLTGLGFEYDQKQVDSATRKEGSFKGCAEYVFRKVSSTERFIRDRIVESALKTHPYRHLYIEDIFPSDVYQDMINNFPDDYLEIEKTRGTKGYPKRFTAKPKNGIWATISSQLLSGVLLKSICDKFGIDSYTGLQQDLLLVRDFAGYAIPPHTDAISKVISALFYLPTDASAEQEGTSIYVPNKKGFTCTDGRHYKFEDFKKIWTAPFKPNSLFLFMRTDNSFHGVEPCNHERNVLLYNIKK